jgi:hypothetical protein
MESAYASDNKIDITFDPTLFIFLGTTAKKVGWRLKQLYNEAYGEIPVVKFLLMDIDSSIDQQGLKLFDKHSEYLDLAGFDPAVVIKNIANHPYINAWWPKASPPAGRLNGGGGSPRQMRLIGRMSFFYNFRKTTSQGSIHSGLETALNSLKLIQKQRDTTEIENEKYRFTVNDGSIKVYLVFSPCGGTGSSMAFDLAYLCRKLLENNNPKIISMSMAPSVFLEEIKPAKAAERKKAMANAYAWFRENNYLIENPEWNVQYSDEVNISIDNPPFDFQYIVGIENRLGQRLSSLDDVANMMAQALFSSTGLPLTGNIKQTLANVEGGLGERFEGKACAYSTFAAASIVFPGNRLQDYCASRFAHKIIKEGLLSAKDESLINRTASLILSRNSLLDRDLILQFLKVPAVPYIHEQELKNAPDVARAVSIIENQYMEVQLLVKDRENAINAKYKDILAESKLALEKEILQFTRQYGLEASIKILERLCDQSPLRQSETTPASFNQVIGLINQNGISDQDLKREKEEYEHSKKALSTLDDGFEDKLERLVAGKAWERKFKTAKESVIKELKDAIDAMLLQAAQNQAKKLLNELFGLASRIQSELIVAKTNLENGLKPLEVEIKKLLEASPNSPALYEFRREITVDFESYYEDFLNHVTGVNDFSFIPASISSIEEFSKWVKQNLFVDLKTFTSLLFKPMIDNLSLLSIIQELALSKGQDPKAYLNKQINDVKSYCQPFFKYRGETGVGEPTTDVLIGVEDETNRIIPVDEQRDAKFIRTGIKNRIDFLVLAHGLPIHVLDDIPTCQQMYNIVLKPAPGKDRPDDPLHVLPEIYKSTEDVSPDRDQESRQWFAIGFAFNYIIHTGRNYYVDINKDRQKNPKYRPASDCLLGKSNAEAKKNFSQNAVMSKQVEEAVDKEVSEMGNAAAIAYLEAVIEAYLGKISSLSNQGDSATGLVNQYRQELADIRKYQESLKS